MKRPGFKSALIGAVILIDVALVLFPDWIAVDPGDPSLTTWLGHSWFTSPPTPPEHFSGEYVRRGTDWKWMVAVVSATGGLAAVFIP
jgi:hypothetical protein